MIQAIRAFLVLLGVGILATIIFVKPGRLGGESGGTQASKIITAGTSGLADVIRAVQGS